MAASKVISLPSLDQDRVGLRAEFEWQDDRFAHTITVAKGGSRFVAWESQCLGPVYQQLHEQEDPSGRSMVLLVGASGTMHWSMSVLAIEPGKLAFDVAGRSKSNTNSKFVEAAQASHYFRASDAATLLQHSKVTALADSADTLLFQDHIRTSIWASCASSEQSPFTVRWKYLMMLEEN